MNLEYNEPLIIDPTYGTGLREYQKIAPTLRSHRFGLLVLVTPRSTNTQSQHTNITLEENVTNIYDPYNKVFPKDQQTITSLRTNSSNGNAWIVEGKDTQIMETQLKLMNDNSPTLTSWWVDFPAKRFLSLVKDMDLTTPEAHSFLMSHGFSPTKDPNIFCLKTSKVYLVTTAAKLSRQSLGFSPTLGMTLNGKFLTQKTSVYPKTGNGSSLSDILEKNVDIKYFLSEEVANKLLVSLGT